MPEWWTYGLSDFLLFSPRTYYRLLERYNEAVWPAQIVTLGVGVGILVVLRRPSARRGRIISLILASLWAWVAWAFVWERYATINWAAMYFLPLFALEVLLLGWIGGVRGRLGFRLSRDPPGMVGLGLFLFALVLYPTLAPLLGRTWEQAEVFGVAPDPTVIASLGLILLAEGRIRWELLAAPILWCGISGATLGVMGSAEALLPPVVALLTGLTAGWTRRKNAQLREPQIT